MVLNLVSGTSGRPQRSAVPGYALGGGGAAALTGERALAKLPGVSKSYANPAAEAAYLAYDPTLISPNAIIAAVAGLGFPAGKPRLLGEHAPGNHAPNDNAG